MFIYWSKEVVMNIYTEVSKTIPGAKASGIDGY